MKKRVGRTAKFKYSKDFGNCKSNENLYFNNAIVTSRLSVKL